MARAFENGVYFIAANRYGRERGVQFSGGSCVLNPDGSIQAYLDNGEGIVYGEVDLERSRDKIWGHTPVEPVGNCLADRRPAEYITLTHNTYLGTAALPRPLCAGRTASRTTLLCWLDPNQPARAGRAEAGRHSPEPAERGHLTSER